MSPEHDSAAARPRPPVPGPPAGAPGGADATAPAVPDLVADVDARLEGLSERAVAEHVAVLDEVHRTLQDALAALDEA